MRRDRSASSGNPSLNRRPAERSAFLTPSASMKSRVIAWPIRKWLRDALELPKTTTSPWRLSPPDEVIATSEYRSQFRRTTLSDSDDSGTSPRAIATPSAAASFAYTPAPSGPNVRSCETTVLPRDSASLMLAVVSPGTLTMTRWTSRGSVRPASAMARCVASATFRIWPIPPTSSRRIGSEPARPTPNTSPCRTFIPCPLSVETSRLLKAEAVNHLELLRERHQRPLLDRPGNQLHAHRQPVVQTSGEGDRGRVREADWKHDLDVAPLRLAEERRHILGWHGDEAQRRRQPEAESVQPRLH